MDEFDLAEFWLDKALAGISDGSFLYAALHFDRAGMPQMAFACRVAGGLFTPEHRYSN